MWPLRIIRLSGDGCGTGRRMPDKEEGLMETLTQDDIENLAIFAENEFCIKCPCANCWTYYTGNYQNCKLLVREFIKAHDNRNAFLNSVQKPFVPGKCLVCRRNELNDKDQNYTLVTAKRRDGKIHFHGYVCSVHLEELEESVYVVTKHTKMV
jgi:hypothetical protein